jgi:hypothetical protein
MEGRKEGRVWEGKGRKEGTKGMEGGGREEGQSLLILSLRVN